MHMLCFHNIKRMWPFYAASPASASPAKRVLRDLHPWSTLAWTLYTTMRPSTPTAPMTVNKDLEACGRHC